MYTVETALDALKKFDIDEPTLREWEYKLGLTIQVDEYGRKQYSPHHINLFKNVKKHLALGRTLDEIKRIINLPPNATSKPQQGKVAMPVKNHATQPRRANMQAMGGANVIQLVDRLMGDKDQLQRKLVETEKLNSHLYNANTMFHRKVRELTGQIGKLKEQMKENQNFKLMDEKDKLHKQCLELEKLNNLKTTELEAKRQEIISLQEQVQILDKQLRGLHDDFDARRFCGDWLENGQLVEVVYDNFGINIESERSRRFRIAEKPSRTFGNSAIITTQYEYETNNLWRRTETMILAYLTDERLEGELIAEYVLDGVPVAKAIYRVQCTRNRP